MDVGCRNDFDHVRATYRVSGIDGGAYGLTISRLDTRMSFCDKGPLLTLLVLGKKSRLTKLTDNEAIEKICARPSGMTSPTMRLGWAG